MSSYVFLLKPSYEGPAIDMMMDVTSAIDPTFKDRITVAKVCDRIDGTNDVQRNALLRDAIKPHTDVLNQVQFLRLRARYAMCDGPYLVHCDCEMKLDELQEYLRSNPEFVQRLKRSGRI
jgi:hypothetical protein